MLIVVPVSGFFIQISVGSGSNMVLSPVNILCVLCTVLCDCVLLKECILLVNKDTLSEKRTV
jgi:hypothetical protein